MKIDLEKIQGYKEDIRSRLNSVSFKNNKSSSLGRVVNGSEKVHMAALENIPSEVYSSATFASEDRAIRTPTS